MYGIKIIINVFILIFCLSFAATQTCDSSSDVTQCSDGQFCRNNQCENALTCGFDPAPCAALLCVSNYCQPFPCTSTGQCVHGHVCEQYTPLTHVYSRSGRWCVYPVVYSIEEGSGVTLTFKEPATPGSYKKIQWFKGGRFSRSRAEVNHTVKTQYYGDFCTGHSPCSESGRAHLNRDTGELTIKNMSLRDEGFYYYLFFTVNRTAANGFNYEYKVNVYVTPALTIEGLPDYVAVGTSLTLTCTADRIRPEPVAMYWVVNGINVTGSITAKEEDADGVFTQTSVYIHRVIKEEETITCVLVPVYGDLVMSEAIVNPGYGPTGYPVVEALPYEAHKGETVRLTCLKPKDPGNPPSDIYTWRRLDLDDIKLETTHKMYTFIMDVPGNYTCRCANQFGESEVSDAMEIMLLPDGTTGTADVGLIAGCVVGGLVVVALVLVAVIFCKKYKISFNVNVQSRRDGETNTHAVNTSASTAENDGNENPDGSRAHSVISESIEINEGTMAEPEHEGYVTITTYEDIQVGLG